MARQMNLVKAPILGLIAIAVGFFGLGLLFSDLGPGETLLGRSLTALLLFFFSGLAIGFLTPGLWPLAGLVA